MQVIGLSLLATSLWGQSQLTLSSPGAQAVTGVSAVTVGANRGQNIYYWVVARTPSGYTAPSNTVAFNTVGIANLSGSNYVTVSWNSVPLATGYDVIRSSTATYPASTSCASCAVVLNQAGVTFNDQGGALSAYPPNGSLGVTDAAGNITIDNLSEQYPFANLQLQTGRYNYTTRLTDDRSKIVPCTIVSGTGNAIVCNGSAQSPTRPPIGTLTGTGRLATIISLIPGTSNTGATTINPDGLGVVTVQKVSSGALAALVSGDLVAGVPYLLRYNGTVFVVDPGSGGGGGTPGGSNTQVQYNNTGAFAGSSLFTFNSGTGEVAATSYRATGATPGLLALYESSPGTNHVDIVAPSSLAAITQYTWPGTPPAGSNTTFTCGVPVANVSSCTFAAGGGVTYAASATWTANGAVSAPAAQWTGTVFSGGTGTTTVPMFLIQPSDATPSVGWDTTGTVFAINGHSASAGKMFDVRIDGNSALNVNLNGGVTASGQINANAVVASKFGVDYSSVFSVSGCSASAAAGGATAGKFTSGTTGVCTATITMGAGMAGATGWSCWANNLTTAYSAIANVPRKTGGSTTTAILSMTTANLDVIEFGCISY